MGAFDHSTFSARDRGQDVDAPGPTPTAGRPRIRIIIPAYKTDETLPQCLDALCTTDVVAAAEIVVVDDGGNDDLDEHLAVYPIDVIRGATASGAAAARNRGATPDADILVFLDADVVIEPGAIERLVQPIIDGRADATVGNYSDNVSGMTFAQSYKQLYISRVYCRQQGYIQNQYWTALGAIRSDVFYEIGGFRTVSTGAAGEDTELGQRLSQLNKRVYSVTNARGRHLKLYTVGSIIKNDFQKGVKDFQLTLTNRTRITDHRHATRVDIGAVVMAYCALLALALGWLLFPGIAGWIFAATIGAYALVRSEMLTMYAAQGPLSLLKSFFMLFCLDVVRGLCVLYGGSEIVLHKPILEGIHNDPASSRGLPHTSS